MRIPPALAFIGAATLSLSAFANPSIAPSSAADHGAPAQARPMMYGLTADEAKHMRGAFRLDDGRTMTVTSRMNKLYVDMDGKHEELVPVGPNKFVMRDTGTTVAFNQVPFAEEVVVDEAAR